MQESPLSVAPSLEFISTSLGRNSRWYQARDHPLPELFLVSSSQTFGKKLTMISFRIDYRKRMCWSFCLFGRFAGSKNVFMDGHSPSRISSHRSFSLLYRNIRLTRGRVARIPSHSRLGRLRGLHWSWDDSWSLNRVDSIQEKFLLFDLHPKILDQNTGFLTY